MIDAIQEFDVERGEDVNMRVGVHTGTVLCGIVGTRRFKFDVWSNDVTFANKLESTGLPGRVHISEKTATFLRDLYVLENYEDLQGDFFYSSRANKNQKFFLKILIQLKFFSGTKTYLIQARAPVVRQEIKVAELPMQRYCSINRKSSNISHSSKRNHYLSLLTDAR